MGSMMKNESFIPTEFNPISDKECKDFIAALKWLEEMDEDEPFLPIRQNLK